MKLKNIIDEDFVNYKKPSMFLVFPTCNFKCCRDAGKEVCQNQSIFSQPTIEISHKKVVERYLNNPITKAIVCGGLEPFDSFGDILDLLGCLRYNKCEDDVVIYTGYNSDEIEEDVKMLIPYGNIIIKYGRFIPDGTSHLDEVLGVNLASENQYAEKIC